MFYMMLLAGIGGFIGTCCRFLVNKLFLNFWNLPFPVATLTINVIGCFLIGLISGISAKNGVIDLRLVTLLSVGFCGGFTTFSTFSFEMFSLASNGQMFISLLYCIISVALGFLATWFALFITR